jgi:hypothetical protein
MAASIVNRRREYLDNQIPVQSKIATRIAQGENTRYDSMKFNASV